MHMSPGCLSGFASVVMASCGNDMRDKVIANGIYLGSYGSQIPGHCNVFPFWVCFGLVASASTWEFHTNWIKWGGGPVSKSLYVGSLNLWVHIS